MVGPLHKNMFSFLCFHFFENRQCLWNHFNKDPLHTYLPFELPPGLSNYTQLFRVSKKNLKLISLEILTCCIIVFYFSNNFFFFHVSCSCVGGNLQFSIFLHIKMRIVPWKNDLASFLNFYWSEDLPVL